MRTRTPSSLGEVVGLFVTNSIKLAGLAIGVHEAFWVPTPHTSTLALATVMMTGAQGAESFFRNFFQMREAEPPPSSRSSSTRL